MQNVSCWFYFKFLLLDRDQITSPEKRLGISALNQNINKLINTFTKEVLITRVKKARKKSGYEIPKAIILVISLGAIYLFASYRELSQSKNNKKA